MIHVDHISAANSTMEVLILLITAAREHDICLDERLIMDCKDDDPTVLYYIFSRYPDIKMYVDVACERCKQLDPNFHTSH